MKAYWDYILFNNSIRDWLIALGIVAGAVFFLRGFQSFIIKRLKSFSATTKTTIDDFIVSVLQSSITPLLYVTAIYIGLQYLNFQSKVQNVLQISVIVFGTFYILRVITSFFAYAFRQALSKREKNEQREKQSKGILIIIQIIIWLVGILFLINNLGYDITTLVAGLGIGGIAIAWLPKPYSVIFLITWLFSLISLSKWAIL